MLAFGPHYQYPQGREQRLPMRQTIFFFSFCLIWRE